MSYEINICFKNCPKNKVVNKINEFKDLIKEHKYELIKENFYWFKQEELYAVRDIEDKWLMNRVFDQYIENWLRNLFSFRVYYAEEIKSLCFSCSIEIPEIKKWFDGEIYFQDSCDQDYDYADWEFNKKYKEYTKEFKDIKTSQELVEKCKNTPHLKNRYDNLYYDHLLEQETKEDIEYYKKSCLYNVCYDKVESIWENGIKISCIDCEIFFDYDCVTFLKRCLVGLEDVEKPMYVEKYDWAKVFNYKGENS